MDVYVALPNGHRGVTLGQLTQITEVAEELGFNGVWPLDHVLVGPDLKDRYPWVIGTTRATSGRRHARRKAPHPIGGASDAALRRAATLGDVWQSTGLDPDEFGVTAEKLRAFAKGRRIELGARTTLAGSPDAVLAKIKGFQKAGAEHICAYFGSTVADFVPGMRAFAWDVMPALRP